MSGVVNASHSAEVSDRLRLSNTAGSGVQMKLKNVSDRNLTSEFPIDKNVSHMKHSS